MPYYLRPLFFAVPFSSLRNTITQTSGPGGTVETFAAVDHFDFGDETADGWNAIAYGTLPGDGSAGIPAADKHNADRSRTDAAGTVVLHQAPDPAGTGSADVPTTLIDHQTGSNGQSIITTTLIAAANVTGTANVASGALPTSTDPDQTRKSRQTFDAAGNLLIDEVFDTYAVPSSSAPLTGYRLIASNEYHPTTGRLAYSTNGLAQTTSYTYDPLTGLLASVTKPNGEVTTNEYDSAGNRTRLTYTGAPAGGSGDTRWTYDAMGRAVEETVAGIAESRTWIYAGLVTTYNDRNGVDHVTTLNPVAGTLHTTAVDDNLTYSRTETYASTGGMREVTESLTDDGMSVYDSTFRYDVDLSDSVSTDTRQIGFGTKRLDHVVRLDIDDRRRVDARTTAWGADPNTATDLWSDDFDVDTLGRQTGVLRTIDDLAADIDSIWNDTDEPDDLRVSYGYNADGSRDSSQRFNVANNASAAAWSDYDYTPGGRVEMIEHHNNAGGTYLAQHQYAYGAAGRLASQSDHRTDGAGGFNHVSNRQFTHDAAGQLTQALETINAGTTVVRDYTDGQSSTDAVFLVGDDNRLTRDDRYDYLYTPEGQLSIRTSRLSPSAGAVDEFRYDPAGRLIEVTMKDPGGAVTGLVQYGYDANGLMSGRRELAADGTTVLSHTGYLHAGLQRVAELDLSQADPTITHLYLHGTQANEAVATSTFTDSGYDTVWSFTDALGSVTAAATKSLGDWSVVHTVTAEYGGSPSRIGDTNVEALMSLQVWAGHHRDDATGLIEAKARWYDPDSGRFTVPDPKGFAAGDSSLYRYVGNGPGNATDPTGLAPPFSPSAYVQREFRAFLTILSKRFWGGSVSNDAQGTINHYHGYGGAVGGVIRYGSAGTLNSITEPTAFRSRDSQIGMQSVELPMSFTPLTSIYHLIHGQSAAGESRSRLAAGAEGVLIAAPGIAKSVGFVGQQVRGAIVLRRLRGAGQAGALSGEFTPIGANVLRYSVGGKEAGTLAKLDELLGQAYQIVGREYRSLSSTRNLDLNGLERLRQLRNESCVAAAVEFNKACRGIEHSQVGADAGQISLSEIGPMIDAVTIAEFRDFGSLASGLQPGRLHHIRYFWRFVWLLVGLIRLRK